MVKTVKKKKFFIFFLISSAIVPRSFIALIRQKRTSNGREIGFFGLYFGVFLVFPERISVFLTSPGGFPTSPAEPRRSVDSETHLGKRNRTSESKVMTD